MTVALIECERRGVAVTVAGGRLKGIDDGGQIEQGIDADGDQVLQVTEIDGGDGGHHPQAQGDADQAEEGERQDEQGRRGNVSGDGRQDEKQDPQRQNEGHQVLHDDTDGEDQLGEILPFEHRFG